MSDATNYKTFKRSEITKRMGKACRQTKDDVIIKANYLRERRLIRIAFLSIAFIATPVAAETVNVKYRGPIPLDTFECRGLNRSSFVTRVCYQPQKRYMLVRLNQTYYHYCGVGQNVVSQIYSAESVGRFYRENIKVSSNGGLYDCRKHPLPLFE